MCKNTRAYMCFLYVCHKKANICTYLITYMSTHAHLLTNLLRHRRERRARPWRGCRVERESLCRTWVQTVWMRWLQWARCMQHSESDDSVPRRQLMTNICLSSTARSLHCVMMQPPCHIIDKLSLSAAAAAAAAASPTPTPSLPLVFFSSAGWANSIASHKWSVCVSVC